jgi:hypothetical protein
LATVFGCKTGGFKGSQDLPRLEVAGISLGVFYHKYVKALYSQAEDWEV